MSASVERRVDELEVFWLARGCRRLRPHEPRVDAVLDRRLFFDFFESAPMAVVLCQELMVPAAVRRPPSVATSVAETVVRVLLRPAPADAFELFVEGLTRAGVDPREHDLRLRAEEWRLEEFGLHRVGWEARLDGIAVGRASRLEAVGGRSLATASLELLFRVDLLDEVVCGPSAASDDEQGQWAAVLLEHAPPELLGRAVDDALDIAERLLELALPAAAWRWIVRAWSDLEILEIREGESVRGREAQRRRLAAAVLGAVHTTTSGRDAASSGGGG